MLLLVKHSVEFFPNYRAPVIRWSPSDGADLSVYGITASVRQNPCSFLSQTVHCLFAKFLFSLTSQPHRPCIPYALVAADF